MQNFNDEYLQHLEKVIILKLLPAYISNCEHSGIIPDLSDIPNSIVRRAQAKENLPLLLKPFKKTI
jgi:hypothetical protein